MFFAALAALNLRAHTRRPPLFLVGPEGAAFPAVGIPVTPRHNVADVTIRRGGDAPLGS